jgi:hypothetical protein
MFFVSAQDLKITYMDGTYDLDEDQLHEFVTIETGFVEDAAVSVVRYYEIDEEGYQRLNWELETPHGLLGSFVGVKVGDLNGDGVPELVTVLNVSDVEEEEILQPIVFYYSWDKDGFTENPGGTFNLSSGERFLRCHNLELVNVDGDSDQELAVSLGSPVRGIKLLDISDDGSIRELKALSPEGLKSGIGFVYVASVDNDRDGFDELLTFSPEGSILRVQPFFNTGGEFLSGDLVEQEIQGIDGFLPFRISKTDWDADGFNDVLLPFQSGHVVALTPSIGMVSVSTLPVDGGPMSDMNITDFNHDGFNDILLVSGEMNILTLAYGTNEGLISPVEYFTLEAEHENTQVFTSLPIEFQGEYSGSIVAAGWDGRQTSVFITDIGKTPDIVSPPHSITELDIRDQEDILSLYPELNPDIILDFPRTPKPLESVGQPLPAGVLPRHVLPVNQSFAYTLPEDEATRFFSFRWLEPPPRGMFFHYESKSIRWIPDDSQLGAYHISYHVEMKVGENVKLETSKNDTLLTYQMIPDLEGYDEKLWVYVNDLPAFLSEPSRTEFIANSEFIYKPLILDRNSDADLRYELEVKPEGMLIDGTNTIRWKTDSTHVDVYDVRIIVSDGFDRALQEFRLFARAGIKILSQSEIEIQVEKPYTYKVEVWRPDLKYQVGYELIDHPEGMIISEEGMIAWTPSVSQIDTQSYFIVANHGMARDTQWVNLFVNHPPIVEEAPPLMNVVNLGEDFDFEIMAQDPNANDKLIFTAVEMPEGMRMDPYTARIHWEPNSDNIDFSHLKIEITDGRETKIVESDFFVNAPIRIVSLPPMVGSMDSPFEYPILISDQNRGALLPYLNPIRIDDVDRVRIYSVNISDDIYRENIDRYIRDWETAEAVYLIDPESLGEENFARLNLKKYVPSIFYEDDRLIVIIEALDKRTVSIKDMLWEFFQGSKGVPPRVMVERMSPYRYSLLDFPDGMVVDEYSGSIRWTPGKNQFDIHPVKIIVSDGYTRDEQMFDVYINYPPIIVSNSPVGGMVEEVFKYQIRVEDKNSDAELKYSLLKGPQGMQISEQGKIVWIPKTAQINNNYFTVKVEDGYTEDIQENKLFININPTIISTPKPVALTGHEYRYRIMAEDLNSDKIQFRAIKLPKYSTFNRKTGLFRWKPRARQRGPNDIIITAIDERGATTVHEVQVHVFEDPSARQMVNRGWPLLLTFVGVMFAWGMAQI